MLQFFFQNGQTALHIIARKSQGSAENWKMLIDVGFAINLQDNVSG